MAWEYLESKRPHSHDVRAFTVVARPELGPLLVSGGNDARLFAYRTARFTRVRPYISGRWSAMQVQ